MMMNKIMVSAILAVCLTAPAFAQTSVDIGASATATAGAGGVNVGVGAGANAEVNLRAQIVARAKARADEEIERRVDALNKLSARVNAMERVSASMKTNLSATLQSQISAMKNLQARIASDAAANSTTSLKADIQSITKAYWIFRLVMPQAAIEAAADRIMTIDQSMGELSAKLRARIAAAQSAGNDMSAASSALADMNARVADAKVQAQAAIDAVVNLKPDNGDQSAMASNNAALKAAREKVRAAQQDLVAARQDARAIVQALASFKADVRATTSASGNADL